jgi:hypothetical protein
MRGAIPPLPNTPSCSGAQLKHRDKFNFIHWIGEWVDPGFGLDAVTKRKILSTPLSEIRPQSSSPYPCHCTDWATPKEKRRKEKMWKCVPVSNSVMFAAGMKFWLLIWIINTWGMYGAIIVFLFMWSKLEAYLKQKNYQATCVCIMNKSYFLLCVQTVHIFGWTNAKHFLSFLLP